MDIFDNMFLGTAGFDEANSESEQITGECLSEAHEDMGLLLFKHLKDNKSLQSSMADYARLLDRILEIQHQLPSSSNLLAASNGDNLGQPSNVCDVKKIYEKCNEVIDKVTLFIESSNKKTQIQSAELENRAKECESYKNVLREKSLADQNESLETSKVMNEMKEQITKRDDRLATLKKEISDLRREIEKQKKINFILSNQITPTQPNASSESASKLQLMLKSLKKDYDILNAEYKKYKHSMQLKLTAAEEDANSAKVQSSDRDSQIDQFTGLAEQMKVDIQKLNDLLKTCEEDKARLTDELDRCRHNLKANASRSKAVNALDENDIALHPKVQELTAKLNEAIFERDFTKKKLDEQNDQLQKNIKINEKDQAELKRLQAKRSNLVKLIRCMESYVTGALVCMKQELLSLRQVVNDGCHDLSVLFSSSKQQCEKLHARNRTIEDASLLNIRTMHSLLEPQDIRTCNLTTDLQPFNVDRFSPVSNASSSRIETSLANAPINESLPSSLALSSILDVAIKNEVIYLREETLAKQRAYQDISFQKVQLEEQLSDAMIRMTQLKMELKVANDKAEREVMRRLSQFIQGGSAASSDALLNSALHVNDRNDANEDQHMA